MNRSNVDNYHSIDDVQLRDRANRLFTYLLELTKLRTKAIRTLQQYEQVLWLKDIPQEPECHCIAWESTENEKQSEVWVEIHKPKLKPPPKAPELLYPWLDPHQVEDSSKDFPELRERIPINILDGHNKERQDEEQILFQKLEECPEIESLWEQYVEEEWWPWAEEDRRLRNIYEVYKGLFSIYQKQQRLGETYEVVLGVGYLTWLLPSGQMVARHLITAQTSLTFDAIRGVIKIDPAGEGARPILEQDMLDPQERPEPKILNEIERQVAEIGDDLWNDTKVQTVLKTWIHTISPYGEFNDTLIPQSDREISATPKIHWAPAIILRKRTERSLLRVFKEIIEQLREGKPIPTGVKRLVTILDDKNYEKNKDKTDTALEVGEIYFPLAANNEQLSIVRQLANRQGVLVQGPPGTGKSHTIANLVCHLLATGHRVLVTSHAARALKVLRDKFPKEIAELCVVALGDDLTSMQALEESIRGITERYNNWDPERNQKLIFELEEQLNETRKREASLLQELRALREIETYRYPPQFGTYKGTAQEIAKRLREEEPRYSWLSTEPEKSAEPPLSNEEFKELIQLLRNISNDQETELSQIALDPESIMSHKEFITLVREEKEALFQCEKALQYKRYPGYAALARASKELRDSLKKGFLDLITAYESVAHHIQPWAKKAAIQIMADRDRAWRELLEITVEYLNVIGDRARRAETRRITGLENRDLSIVKAHAEALLRHLEHGRKLGFGPFRPKAVKEAIYLVNEVRVDGVLCDNPQSLRDLLEWIEITERLDELSKHWSPYAEIPKGTFPEQVAEYWDLCEPLDKALELHTMMENLRKLIRTIPGLPEPTWHELENLHFLRNAIKAVTLEEKLHNIRISFKVLEARFHEISAKPNSHPAILHALEAVRKRDEKRYGKAYEALCNLQKMRDTLRRRHELFQRLKKAAPELASKLAQGFADPIWDKRMGEFVAAWNWARANRWLKRLSDPKRQEKLSHSLKACRKQMREIMGKLAAAKAWRYTFSRMTEYERQHLVAWTKAIQRGGKWRGKYAPLHRRAARESLEQCRSAIPAWVMPIYRVAETVRPGVDVFDVVIVDEASQSGPEALFLQYLAKKIVVVGDDKQISPEFVGLNREDVELLRQQYLYDIPISDAFGVDNSFFTQAEIRYGGRIRLREHFRCMPEIIQFSNDLCYHSEPLIPLRQYGAGRLTPVIITRHVADGYLKGEKNVINPPEAQAIVDQIIKCCQDPAYENKSIGVISLLGEYQARYIEHLLKDQLGPEEMEKRQLHCGDAYAFQGDERDVMFLSMVVAPTEGRRIGTLASQKDERRFNVAVSRAKDQLWLFYTATLNDLSPRCLRYRLLQYCQNPMVQPIPLEALKIDDSIDRNMVSPPSPFESWFEVDVFLKITERGYRVVPQYEVAGYRIDLVVEGMRGRLAVECDGDQWHGVERYEADMARQRMLERCEWTFWRVRGSTFYRDPEEALKSLWQTLDRLGIYPSERREVYSPSAEIEQSSTTEYQKQVDTPSELSEESKAFTQNLLFRKATPEHMSGTVDKLHVPTDRENNERIFAGTTISEVIPYQHWTKRPLPDPRLISIDEVIESLVEISAAEGPILCQRAYNLYLAAAGIHRLGRQIRTIFDRAIRKAVRLGKLAEKNEYISRKQANKFIRVPGTPLVQLRTRGDRMLREIPPSEVAEVMRKLMTRNLNQIDINEESLFRSVLKHYGFVRMTQEIRKTLKFILDFYVHSGISG